MATIQDRKHKRLEELSVSAARAYVESGLHGIEAEVVVALDASPNMARHYESGRVQDVASALLALAMKFDDDGVVPVWSFDQAARHIGKIHRHDYASWVHHHAPKPLSLEDGEEVPGACYTPLIDAIGRSYFPGTWDLEGTRRMIGERHRREVVEYPRLDERRVCPVFVIVVTGGDCTDTEETAERLRRASYLPVFWQFAAIGDARRAPEPGEEDDILERYPFLCRLNRLGNTYSDSASFFEPYDIGNADELYDGLLNGLQAWLAHDAVQEMLVPAAPEEEVDDGLDQLLMSLPPSEAERRARIRAERERRRKERESMAALEVEQAKSWPTIRASAEIESSEEADPVIRTRSDPDRRAQLGTRPYQPEDEDKPGLPPRRPTVSFGSYTDRGAGEDKPPVDEDALETAVERLARIRARRNQRRSGSS